MDTKKTFSDLGLEIIHGSPKVGQTVPIYGMITDILAETADSLVVEVNRNIKLAINNSTKEHIEIVKGRIFEPGIFISEITHASDVANENRTHHYEAISKLVIFGNKQELNS